MPADAPEPKPVCFVVSPIGAPFTEIRKRADQLITYVIAPALGNKYRVIRADHITVPGSINRQVFDHLLQSALVVADLTGHNPNVFYELAVRHAAAKPFIQMIDSKEHLPFDVFDQRTIKFDIHDLDSVEDAKKHLALHEEAITEPGFKIETPIGQAILQSAAIANGSDETKVVMDALDQMQQRFGELESIVRSFAGKRERPTVMIDAEGRKHYRLHGGRVQYLTSNGVVTAFDDAGELLAVAGSDPNGEIGLSPSQGRKGRPATK